MKTRIISGAVLVTLLVALLAVSVEYPAVMFIACAILSAIAVYEALYATGIAKNKAITAVGCAFSVLYILRDVLCGLLPALFFKYANITNIEFLTVLFVLIQFALYLKFHKDINLHGMLGMIALPIVISYAFFSFATLVIAGSALLYVVLVFCWSAIADTGAYFVGVAIGKHKMAPVISPKKSWEGLIGGILSSLLVTFGVCMLYQNCFDVKVNTIGILIATPIFVLIGVMGDLTASLIKRKCEIKDFGRLIPGHGGILDRFDSILMISAAFATLIEYISFMPGGTSFSL